MLDKLVVLQPLVWNSGGYVAPNGSKSVGGYVSKRGYGHEEWNGNPERVWNGQRVFHSQTKGKMAEYGKAGGRLGIIMTAYSGGRPYALGLATSVVANNQTEMKTIARALRFKDEGERLWGLESVRKKFGNRRDRFDSHWKTEHHWVQWRAPEAEFVWFDQPIQIDPEGIFPSGDPEKPRKDIAKRHSGHMVISNTQALAIVASSLPQEHPAVVWLRTGVFNPKNIAKSVRSSGPPTPSSGHGSASTAKEAYVRYLQEREVAVDPKHHILQSAFVAYIQSVATEVVENKNAVDLTYKDPSKGRVLVEVKPSDPADVRFAIRTAMGQLLDYRQRSLGRPNLLIVVDAEPKSKSDTLLALSNGFGIAFRSAKGFKIVWPN